MRIFHGPSGWIFHALNRAVARLPLYDKDADYEAFERVLEETYRRFSLGPPAYCVMSNHWHVVLRPEKPGELFRTLELAR